MCEALAAAAKERAEETVEIEEREAEGGDEQKGSMVHSHASPVLLSATLAMPANDEQPPSQPSGVQHLPQNHHHAGLCGEERGYKLQEAIKDVHHHDNEHDHHDERFRAVRSRSTFRYTSRCSILCVFCADAPRIVSRQRQTSRPSHSMRQSGARSSAWASPSMRSWTGSTSRTSRAC